MRAGLLSDPRVVLLLRELFVPVHISALNTPHCLRDPRDAEILRGQIRPDTGDFGGGEREAFLLPDGRMQRVFLSLNGHATGEYGGVAGQYTRAGRRAEAASAMFRKHGAIALQALHGELPAVWQELWNPAHEAVVALASVAPRWPAPAAGESVLRVFVRNSYRMYDDLHGCQLVPVAPGLAAAWIAPLQQPGDRASLPAAAFLALARSMVPRGMVDTELAPDSVRGELVLVATHVDANCIGGRIDGNFALTPTDKAEVGKRLNAAVLFASKGKFAGRYTLDRTAGTFLDLRVVATEVAFDWRPGFRRTSRDHEPRHQIAIEWVRGEIQTPKSPQ